MSDPYIHCLTQKYRLVAAIAVLKDKPQDVSIENYITELKSKLNDEKIDDLDITVCSDDFDMEENLTGIDKEINIMDRETSNENSISILNDNNIEMNGNDIRFRNASTHIRQEMSTNIRMGEMNFIQESQAIGQKSINMSQIDRNLDSQSTFCETQHVQDINFNENENFNDILQLNEVLGANEIHVSNEVNINTSDNTYYDSQTTELYTVHGFTQNYTHVSQSQNYDEFVISNKFIKAKSNIQPDNTKTYYPQEVNSVNDFQSNANKIQVIQSDTEISSKDDVIDVNENRLNETQLSEQINEPFPQYAQDLNELEISETTIHKVSENERDKNEEITEIDENLNNETQIVSFKVIEELNKIKNYINKKIERRLSNDGSIDSGYRSDSQSKFSFRSSLQLSGNWVNQSANSLYEYITQCPLLATTNEIIGEIAQVLGQLIDRLHEEERYPSFLDELLENVNRLLQDIFEESGGEDVLLRKDEKIQRLLFLNKSAHIQKYTIEKITIILENIQSHLTNSDETYEISNISEMENISYIFHVLEVILQRYIRGKSMSSQETTNSQIEMKKSSITEMWRRKWNPNYKEDVIEECIPRKCVLMKCNEVLNKLVVACMDGYSLVAFAALNCFNLLQN